MNTGGVWSFLFFLFLTFAAFSTITAVFENLIAINVDLYGWSRKKSLLICAVSIIILSMPAVLGFNVLSEIQPLGTGTNIMDFEDFIVSNNLLPLGSLYYVLFCSSKNGWGWDNFLNEANIGKGLTFPKALRPYMNYGIPAIIIVIYLKGYFDFFSDPAKELSSLAITCWMAVGVLFLAFVLYCALARSKKTSK